MIRALFAVFVLLALLGDARIFLFVLNRFVFGSHREERSPWTWLMFAVPPLLLGLTLLFWPLSRMIDFLLSTPLVERLAPDRIEDFAWSIVLAKVGSLWLAIAAAVGVFWIVDRIRVLQLGNIPIAGVETAEPTVIRLRHAHIPFASLRRLGAHNDLYDLEVTRHEVFIDELPQPFDGYRIAFLTDTHVAAFVRRTFYSEIRKQVAAFDPDLILLGGDFVSFRRHIPLMGEVLLDGLAARDGIFAVLGNHDIWAGAEETAGTLRARGVQLVINRSVPLRRGDARLALVGIDEVYRGEPDVAAAFAGVDPARPCLGISHHPDIIELLDGRRIDLLLCGHAHGGQIRFPFFGAVVVPSEHEAEYAAGFHRVRNVLMYVSRGIGAIPPIRILCRPEVATFTLRRGRRNPS